MNNKSERTRRDFLRAGVTAGWLLLLSSALRGAAPADTPAADPLLEIGCLDVTRAPYRADPTGQTDSTRALQRAIDDARDRGLVCFFPTGTYLVSDTLSCSVRMRKVPRPLHVDGGTEHYMPIQTPNVLIGSTKGPRPVIKLAPDAKGFDDPARPKQMVWIWAQTYFDAPGREEPIWGKEQSNINFNHHFIGIDLDVRGHAGAIGIRHSGSQGSTLANVTIHAEGAYTGLSNCCGQGGGTYGIEVVGGRHGIVIDSDSRFPLLTACVFRGQTQDCVGYKGNAIQVPTMFVGCEFRPVGSVAIDMSTTRSHGGLSLLDCVCELPTGSAVAVATGKRENLFVEDTHVRGATALFSGGPALTEGWSLVGQFSSGTEDAVQIINGEESPADVVRIGPAPTAPAVEEIRRRHFSGLPSFEDADAVNVKAFGAKGDGRTDDTAAFRRAVQASDKVFVPKGDFRLSGRLELGERTRLFGLSRSFCSIGLERAARTAEGGKASAAEKRGAFTLATPNSTAAAPALYYLNVEGTVDWRCGRGIWILLGGTPTFSGQAGGRFYGGGIGKSQVVEHIRQPTAFYALNVERALTHPQCEIRGCAHVRIYYFKVEAGSIQPGSPNIDRDANTPCRITGSRDIRVYGMQGNVLKLVNQPMLEIVDSSNVLVCQLKAFKSGDFPHLRETRAGKTLEIPSTQRCALFVRD